MKRATKEETTVSDMMARSRNGYTARPARPDSKSGMSSERRCERIDQRRTEEI